MDSDILKKLQKLKAMAERGSTFEAANASRLFDKLVDKYDIDTSEIEERKHRDLTGFSYEIRQYINHACKFLGLKTFEYTERRRLRPMIVDSTQEEFDLINDIARQIKNMMSEQKKIAKRRVDSYITGFIITTYPLKDEEVHCPKCEQVLTYSYIDLRYLCPACKYVGKKLKPRTLFAEDVFAGKMSSGRMLEKK